MHSLTSLPTEILSLIISHLYPPWTLSILDRPTPSYPTLNISGLPTTTKTLTLTHPTLIPLALSHESHSFTHTLTFTTSAIHWRLLIRLRRLQPHRFNPLLNSITHITFCCPPLFTNRVPYAQLPSLSVITLDYTSRNANFRCQGSLSELTSGALDPTIVTFARDTERFDGGVVEDAWRARRISVRVVKRMVVFERVGEVDWSGIFLRRNREARRGVWGVRVVAGMEGGVRDVRVVLLGEGYGLGRGEGGSAGGDDGEEIVIWTVDGGYRETASCGKEGQGELLQENEGGPQAAVA